MLFYKRLTYFLSSALLLAMSSTIYAASSFKKTPNPISHTYTHEVLKKQRAYGKAPFRVFQTCDLNAYITPGDHAQDTFHTAILGGVTTPYMMLQLGFNGQINSEVWKDIKGSFTEEHARKEVWQKAKDFSSINLVLGKLYQSPFYLRVGRDYMPFGRHFSEIIPLIEINTHAESKKGTVLQIGGSRSNNYAQWQGAVFGFTNAPLAENRIIIGGTVQHQSLKPFKFLERYTVGGGIGGLLNGTKAPTLFYNFYGDIHYSIGPISDMSSRLEYMHNALADNTSYNALHAEISKYLKHIPFTSRYIPSAFTIGGMTQKPQSAKRTYSVLGGYKLAFRKQRIQFMVGGIWLSDKTKPFFKQLHPIVRIGCSF